MNTFINTTLPTVATSAARMPSSGWPFTSGADANHRMPSGHIRLVYPLASRAACALMLTLSALLASRADELQITEDDTGIKISTPQLEAVIRKKSSKGLATYAVTGVAATSFLDKKTSFREAGFGLDIVDWLMEPGSDEAYRDRLDKELVYQFNNSYHGKLAKRSIEGPQICTRVRSLSPKVIRGKDFTAVTMEHRYSIAAPGKKAGSFWQQALVFPEGKRYFLSSDKVTTVNSSDALFLRLDMPGHIRHDRGDTFSEVYLSYHGTLKSSEFFQDFPPDEKFIYRRGQNPLPKRFIRAYHLRDTKTGKAGPWLAGMTLQPDTVYEAWCHQRGYVCLIEEIGGKPIRAGESFGATFVVGYFDSVDEMQAVYDQYAGHTWLEVSTDGWKLVK